MSDSGSETYLLILVGLIVIATTIVFWSFLDVVVLAVSLAVVLVPLHHYFSRYVRRGISAAVVTALVLAAFVGSAFISISILSGNSETLRGIIDTVMVWINNPATAPSVFGISFDRAQVSGWLDSSVAFFTNYWQDMIKSFQIVVMKGLIFFSSLYITLLHGEKLVVRVNSRIPVPLQGHVQKLSDVTVDTLYAIYIVHLAIAAITFVISIPFFYILSYGHILFFSYLCAFCELIPVLGSSVVFIFLGTYALSIGDIPGILLLFFIGYIGVSAIPELYIRPVLMGRRLHLHPLIMFIGFFGGVLTMGIAGFVLGPVFIVLFVTGFRILLQEKRAAKQKMDSSPPE